MTKTVSFDTNLCWLLNMWFQEPQNKDDYGMWPHVRKWLNEQREIGIQEHTHDFVTVSITLKEKSK